LIINAERVAEIHMRHSQTSHGCTVQTDHDQVDVELSPLAPSLLAGNLEGRVSCLLKNSILSLGETEKKPQS
jgi:hypothetical protein